jgi:hypothetical protein
MTQLGGELETAARYMDEDAAILAELAFMRCSLSIRSRCKLAGPRLV